MRLIFDTWLSGPSGGKLVCCMINLLVLGSTVKLAKISSTQKWHVLQYLQKKILKHHCIFFSIENPETSTPVNTDKLQMS